jgi:hypothetical protein
VVEDTVVLVGKPRDRLDAAAAFERVEQLEKFVAAHGITVDVGR